MAPKHKQTDRPIVSCNSCATGSGFWFLPFFFVVMMWRKIHCTLLCLWSSHAHYDAWSPEFEHESTTDRQGACDRGVIIHTAHLDDFVRQHWNKSTYIVHHFVCPYDCFFHRIFFGTNKIDTTINLQRNGRSTDHVTAGTPSLANHNSTASIPSSSFLIRPPCELCVCWVHYRSYVHMTKSAGKVRELGQPHFFGNKF